MEFTKSINMCSNMSKSADRTRLDPQKHDIIQLANNADTQLFPRLSRPIVLVSDL